MQPYQPYLDWIEDQAESMVTTLTAWSNVNSGSSNHAGVARMAQLCLDTLRPLGDKAALTPLPPREQVGDTGKVSLMDSPAGVHVTKRRDAPMQVFLGAHLDTVFPLDSPFQEARRKDNNTLHGPGVADIKGGIVVLCTALEALERSPFAQNIGWEVFLNPDEEIGSPGSHDFLFDCGKRNQLGLIFEPSLPDGTLVSARKGSANFSVVVHGRLAHAGRDFTSGRNAISALMDALLKIEALTDLDRGLTINIGAINGGGPVNVVPDLAIGRLNMRMEAMEDASATIDQIQEIVTETGRRDGIRAELIGALTRPPKPFDAATQKLFESIQSCGKDLGLDLTWRPTGGVCDGNILASAGLPTIDTLGVRGANIHTHDEFMLIDSLVERAQLTALFLMRLANGDCTLTQEILP